jgi:rRNA maturation RNase YbeY
MIHYLPSLAFATSRRTFRKISSSSTIGAFQFSSRLFGCKRGTPGNPPGSIEIYNEQNALPNVDIDKIKQTISEIRDIIGYPTYDVSLILTDDEEMQQTNYETRGVNRPTDILSFQFQDLVDEPGILAEPDFDIPEYYNLGDMMIDVPYVMRRCEEDRDFNENFEGEDGIEYEVDEDDDYVGDDDRGVSGVMSTIYDPEQRIQLLLVHGMLHLVGYDHIEDADYELMVLKEEQVIKELQRRLNADWCDIES